MLRTIGKCSQNFLSHSLPQRIDRPLQAIFAFTCSATCFFASANITNQRVFLSFHSSQSAPSANLARASLSQTSR